MKCLGLTLLLGSISFTTSAMTYRTYLVDNTSITVAEVDLNVDKLQLFLKDSSGNPLRNFNSLETLARKNKQQLLFAMNAGMYHADFSPVGLFVSESTLIAPLNRASDFGNFYLKPNGVFFITSHGALILDTLAYAKQKPSALLATQSGPLLLQHGIINREFSPVSQSKLIRNGVCAYSPSKVLFAISNMPIRFYNFALFFKTQLGCRDALYLDGTVSSLYAPTLHRNDLKADLGPIIAVVK